MVRPSQERQTRALTDAQSSIIGDGTDVGDDGVDYDGGGTNPDTGPGTPPVSQMVAFVYDSATWDGVLDFAVASIWDITLTDDLPAPTFANAPAAGFDAKMEVTYRQPAAGGPFTIAHPTLVAWRDTDGTEGGPPPDMPTADESQLVVVYDTRDGGLTYGGTSDGGSSSPADEEFVAHGAMGATESFDPADGNSHTGTIDDDCTATIVAPAGDGPILMEWWITGDGDGFALTIESAGGTVIGDTPPVSVDGETYRLTLDRIPDSPNDWIVNLVGSSSSSGHYELLVDPGSPPDPYYADGDFLYVLVP